MNGCEYYQVNCTGKEDTSLSELMLQYLLKVASGSARRPPDSSKKVPQSS